MEMKYPNWLTEQMLRGVRRFDMDSYLVALEGWRRGLTLTFYHDPSKVTDLEITGFNQIGKAFSLSDGKKTHYFYRTRGDKVANEAEKAGTNKAEAKKILQAASVPTPEGFSFDREDDMDEVVEKAKEIGFPLVVKPVLGSLGKGVYTNIQSEEELRESVAAIFHDYDYEEVLVERYVKGDEVRVYVVDNDVVGAIKRVPANVTGDGVHSIRELIEEKNTLRKENPHTSTRLIKMDDQLENFLAKQELSLDHTPEKDEIVYVRDQSNISAGGDSIDTTEDISEQSKKIAVQAVQAIPGLHHAGLDLIMSPDGAQVIEINTTAGISLHIFPVQGEPRNVPEKIMDYYFPETKGKAKESKLIYFNYRNILELLRNRELNQVEVADAPVGELYAKRYIISGKVQQVGYRKWIQKKAIEKGLHGYTRNLKNGKVVVVVASTDKQAVEDFKKICYQGPRRANVTEIKEYVWDKQIRIGFEIRQTR
jgi:D-alanine-D-alanine ligase-like ATP-grasp enzyme/acylphosphatase